MKTRSGEPVLTPAQLEMRAKLDAARQQDRVDLLKKLTETSSDDDHLTRDFVRDMRHSDADEAHRPTQVENAKPAVQTQPSSSERHRLSAEEIQFMLERQRRQRLERSGPER